MPVQASPQIVSELAPTGVLRAAINMGNFLLVTGKDPNGDPSGVSPDMAAAIAARLGVPVKYVPYARPGEIADDAEKGEKDRHEDEHRQRIEAAPDEVHDADDLVVVFRSHSVYSTAQPQRSTANATAFPPPRQSAASPRRAPRRFNSYNIVVRRREPDCPIAWPSATAPPLTFTFSGSNSSSRMIATA